MQENYLFEYAVIRVVPAVERGEFINAGVIFLCSRKKFLKCLIHVDAQKLAALCSHADHELIKENLNAFASICVGAKGGGAIAQLDMPSRFRWLTASRSTIVQCSPVHPGLCADPETSLEKIFKQMVL